MKARTKLNEFFRKTGESMTWWLFAKFVGDRSRHFLWRLLIFIRRNDIRRRQAMRNKLPPSPLRIPPEIGFTTWTIQDTGASTKLIIDEALRLASQGGGPEDTGKPYLLSIPVRNLEPSSEVLKFGLNKTLLRVVSDYLEIVPRLASITVMESPANAATPTGSQLFHCDYESVKQVKVFVHCTDVTDRNGPLTAVPSLSSRNVRKAIRYRYGGRSFRIKDSIVNDLVPSEDIATFTGPPGSITLIDTSSCFHYGSRMTAGCDKRLVLQFQYLTPASFDLVFAPRLRHPPIAIPGAFTDLERTVLGMA